MDRIVDEEEYMEFLANVYCDLVESDDESEMLDDWYRGVIPDPQESALVEQLRDEEGHRVEGCYITLKAPTI